MTVVVTGATGFIGSHVVRALRRRSVHVRAVVRSSANGPVAGPDLETVEVHDIGASVDWCPILEGAEAVVHLAGRAHVLRGGSSGDVGLYWRTNVVGTRQLAEAAARAGIKKLVFVSSSRATGAHTAPGETWREDSPCRPDDPDGRTKLEAEQALEAIAAETGLNTIILRPPVVYGPRVGANILELFRLIDRGIPLPLGMVRNRRSLLYVGNLVDAIILVLESPSATSAKFLLSDGDDVSSAELARRIGAALRHPARVWPIPPALLRAAGRVGDVLERNLGITAPITTPNVERLTQSLVLDAGRIRDDLGWRPPYGLDAGLRETAAWYLETLPGARIAASASADRPRVVREPAFKRPFDLSLSGVGLLLSAPLWVLIAASIWLEDGRPIFFRQLRIGRDGRIFRVLKFRSMFQSPAHVEVQARRGDPRITRAGRLLRRTGLDELPQLWNILLGQMSFVGPRPQLEKERVIAGGVERDIYIRDVPGYALRHLVRPGLTGPTQLFAPRDVPHRYKFKYDLVYVRKVVATASRASLLADLKMLAYDLSLILRSVWIAVNARREV
jgi:nucleoside-diphosphate-sugar epimerase/lipopolysaccharide/colanic/teichoic acid biosynthesis glycosyltransferase